MDIIFVLFFVLLGQSTHAAPFPTRNPLIQQSINTLAKNNVTVMRLINATHSIVASSTFLPNQSVLNKSSTPICPSSTVSEFTKPTRARLVIPELLKSHYSFILPLLTNKTMGFGQPCKNRTFWSAFPGARERVFKAQPYLTKQTMFNDTIFNDLFHTSPNHAMINKRIKEFNALVLAECIENKSRFIQVIQKYIYSFNNQTSWSFKRASEGYSVDLASSGLAASLGQAFFMLGDLLCPESIAILKSSVEERVFSPMRSQFASPTYSWTWWFETTNNWNAVCFSSVNNAALTLLSDSKERALFIAGSLTYSNFFKAFTGDGYYPEGTNYYQYAMQKVVLGRELLLLNTAGKFDTLANPESANSANYPFDYPISTGNVINIADDRFGNMFLEKYPMYMNFIYHGAAFDFNKTDSNPDMSIAIMDYVLDGLVRAPAYPCNKTLGIKSYRKFFNVVGVLISRPDDLDIGLGLGFAIKNSGNGGHSHNDIGTYAISINGVKLAGEVGGPNEYNKDTFTSARYNQPMFNSYGHSVPRPMETLQKDAIPLFDLLTPGPKPHVMFTRFTNNSDQIAYDMTSAYNITLMSLLTRYAIHQRGSLNGFIQIIDSVTYSIPQLFETAITTNFTWKPLTNSTFIISGQNDSQICVKITSLKSTLFITSELIHTKNKKVLTRISIRTKNKVLYESISVVYFACQNSKSIFKERKSSSKSCHTLSRTLGSVPGSNRSFFEIQGGVEYEMPILLHDY